MEGAVTSTLYLTVLPPNVTLMGKNRVVNGKDNAATKQIIAPAWSASTTEM